MNMKEHQWRLFEYNMSKWMIENKYILDQEEKKKFYKCANYSIGSGVLNASLIYFLCKKYKNYITPVSRFFLTFSLGVYTSMVINKIYRRKAYIEILSSKTTMTDKAKEVLNDILNINEDNIKVSPQEIKKNEDKDNINSHNYMNDQDIPLNIHTQEKENRNLGDYNKNKMGSKLINVEGGNNQDDNKYNSNNVISINNKVNKNDYFIETNKELKINLNFQNNNIISNIFSNINIYDKISNIFINNKKTYMLKYNNNINEENFFISYFEKKDDNFVPISPWHHIDLKNDDGTYNMIVEITKYNYIKLEIQLREKFNVIKQDKKKGKLRYYHNSIYWNYGALPQTYEYPKHIYQNKSKKNKEALLFTGDNDPLDILDIGSACLKIGQVVPVKVLKQTTQNNNINNKIYI
ncbi:hypothetical protein PFFCH_02412 [Plasmodium falciparum FCH/4]|uniref:inorganic diphosphatase n=2 Tax=Plasmodium falciparum TaxID=5833 RepID=A0A024VQK6_PLAFA|nr:hypothetical protein PFFCH_02412 [Plasmodium falciparum FCH/4]